MPSKAVVLLNLGGPDSLDAVQPFLYNLFSDPFIISIPFGFLLQKPLARYIAKRRSPNVRKQYSQIGRKSPIGEWTEKQRAMLESKLREKDEVIDVFIAMRYWRPFTKEAVEKIKQSDYSKIILMPLYPHFSRTTTESSFAEWDKEYNGKSAEVIKIDPYYEYATYLSAINHRIDEALLKFEDKDRQKVHLLFSAHGTPISLVEKGDPYKGHIEATVKAVMKQRNLDHDHSLCFQSRVGPEEWIKPATDAAIRDLAAAGKKNLLIIPVSFVSDHIETLFELDVTYRADADKAGIEKYVVMQGLNDSELFVQALFELVSDKL